MEALRSITRFAGATEASTVVEMPKCFASFDVQRTAIVLDEKSGETVVVSRDELPSPKMRRSTRAILMYFTFDYATNQELYAIKSYATAKEVIDFQTRNV